ncbi:MAG: hypothetical protein PHE49_04870 [bacterium]|nr:hypothetical protein [bacterium]
MGIHPLARTPGRLITAKGSIDGTLSAFGTVLGKIGMTGDKAQKAMGFKWSRIYSYLPYSFPVTGFL